jgi:hypothetical protein
MSNHISGANLKFPGDDESWPGYKALAAAFSGASACHHDHTLPERLGRQLAREADDFLARLSGE